LYLPPVVALFWKEESVPLSIINTFLALTGYLPFQGRSLIGVEENFQDVGKIEIRLREDKGMEGGEHLCEIRLNMCEERNSEDRMNTKCS
jgi:hypothetical protein